MLNHPPERNCPNRFKLDQVLTFGVVLATVAGLMTSCPTRSTKGCIQELDLSGPGAWGRFLETRPRLSKTSVPLETSRRPRRRLGFTPTYRRIVLAGEPTDLQATFWSDEVTGRFVFACGELVGPRLRGWLHMGEEARPCRMIVTHPGGVYPAKIDPGWMTVFVVGWAHPGPCFER